MELMEEAIMKVDILTREYPPHVYGGAGVHVEELAKVLAERIDVTVRAFDGPRESEAAQHDERGSLRVIGYDVPTELDGDNAAIRTFSVDLQMANDVDGELVHAHRLVPRVLPGAWRNCCMTSRS